MLCVVGVFVLFMVSLYVVFSGWLIKCGGKDLYGKVMWCL